MRRVFLGLLLLAGCQKCSSAPAVVEPPPAVPRTMACTEAFLEVVPITLCDERCAGGDAEACSVAADRYLNGVRVRRDLKRGLERARKGCELGSSLSCAHAASASVRLAVDESDGGEPDLSRHREFQQQTYVKAESECASGQARSCELLAYRYDAPPDGTRPDPARAVSFARRAVELYRKGCDGGDWLLCRRLALLTSMSGLGLEPDEVGARLLYRKACKLGDAASCMSAFDRSDSDETAIPFLQRGCELGDGEACFSWSIRLNGPEKMAALQKACAARYSLGCSDVWRALQRAGDTEGAKKAQQAACELDEKVECPR